jgi:3-dehydroquinate synthase
LYKRSSVKLNLGDRGYFIKVGYGLTSELGEIILHEIPDVTGSVVVTSQIIDDFHGRKVFDGLSPLSPSKILVTDGEEAKSWETAGYLIGEFIKLNLDRKSLVIAVGGGAVGDLAGFTSSIYLRGVRFVHIPTTLLSMVDSSIGGKTAVNHAKGKNLIGSFYQPSLVIADPKFLETLPLREVASGLAEAVKHGVIADESLFNFIRENSSELLDREGDIFSEVIRLNASIKAAYVEKDERETLGVRSVLNYGHTLGHAVERLLSPQIRHGEAVAIGMNYAALLGEKLGFIDCEDVQSQKTVLESLGLSTKLPEVDTLALISLMRRDKKAESGVIKFVIPTGIGSEPVLVDVDEELLEETLKEIR